MSLNDLVRSNNMSVSGSATHRTFQKDMDTCKSLLDDCE